MPRCSLLKSFTGIEPSSLNIGGHQPSRHAYNLVLHKHGDLLYEGVRETVYTRLRSVCIVFLCHAYSCFTFKVAKLVSMSPDDQLLNQICQQWRDHQVTMVMVRDILMYMDRTHSS